MAVSQPADRHSSVWLPVEAAHAVVRLRASVGCHSHACAATPSNVRSRCPSLCKQSDGACSALLMYIMTAKMGLIESVK